MCCNDGCRVEKFSRLVVARCLTGRQDTSPYGCISPPYASRPNCWLSHALLLLYKVKSCFLSQPWPTCWKNSVCVNIHKGEKLKLCWHDSKTINNLTQKQERQTWCISSEFLIEQQSCRLFCFSPACWLEFYWGNEVLVCPPAGFVFGEGCLCVADRGISLTRLLWPAASGSQ